jgi:hypothetical protein
MTPPPPLPSSLGSCSDETRSKIEEKKVVNKNPKKVKSHKKIHQRLLLVSTVLKNPPVVISK